MSKTCNRVPLMVQMKVAEWIKANWERQVVANKWTSTETVRRIEREVGTKYTEGNLRALLKEMPQYNFLHAASNPVNPMDRLRVRSQEVAELSERVQPFIDQVPEIASQITSLMKSQDALMSLFAGLESRIAGLELRLANAEKEVRVRPLTEILSKK